MFYTYIIRSKKDGKFYTGSTKDLRKRFREHNSNKVFSTKNRGPFDLIYYEACMNEQDSRLREKYLKSGMGKRYIKNRLKRFLSLTGFTLIELIAVIAIILILAGIVAPRLSTSFRKQRLDSDARKLIANLILAQNYAIGQKDGHRYYGVTFYPRYYRVIPYDNPGTPLPAVVVPSSVNINGDIPFSEGIVITAGPNSVIFKFDGALITTYGPIVLTNGYSIKRISFTRLTGYINMV